MNTIQAFLLPAIAAAALAACTTEPQVTVNTVPAAAPPPAVSMGATGGTFSGTDRDFAYSAATSNMLEIGASAMAPRRAGDPEVVQYAAMLNQHHTLAMNELAAIMRARGMAVPTQLPPGLHPVMNRLGTTVSGDFDRNFIEDVGITAHRNAIANFQSQIPQLADPQLKAWAVKTLPTLQQHYQVAQQIAARIG